MHNIVKEDEMEIGPVEFSGYTNQASDIGKVAGQQEFQRVHQQQLANIIQHKNEQEKDKTKEIENSDETKIVIDTEAKEPKQYTGRHRRALREETEDTEPELAFTELVEYEDPDLGHNLDWQI